MMRWLAVWADLGNQWTPRPSVRDSKTKALQAGSARGCRRRSGDCARGLPLPRIAEEAGVSARTIGSWFAALRDGGVERLPARPPKGKGPANWLDERTARELKAELDKGTWRRGQDARRWLERRPGKRLTLVVTCKCLGKCEARLTA